MITYHKQFKTSSLSGYSQQFLTENMLLFDIETTGLSSARDHIYCIGCGYILMEDYHITLYFAETPDEEPEILSAFLELASGFQTMITFNGTTFDIPFIKKKTPDFETYVKTRESIDLFREVQKMKCLLQLDSYKQKQVEEFLGIYREDVFNGGQLIEKYWEYVFHPDDELLSILLLHNFEDIKGMFDLIDILSYRQLIQSSDQSSADSAESVYQIQSCDITDQTLDIQLAFPHTFPQRLTVHNEFLTMGLIDNHLHLSFPIQHGELKHFFPDPQNYYYLPDEDTVIHKSVGAYVDPSHRKKATKKNCFIRKNCDYITHTGKGCGCYLAEEYNDKHVYLEIPSPDEASLKQFLDAVLKTYIK